MGSIGYWGICEGDEWFGNVPTIPCSQYKKELKFHIGSGQGSSQDWLSWAKGFFD